MSWKDIVKNDGESKKFTSPSEPVKGVAFDDLHFELSARVEVKDPSSSVMHGEADFITEKETKSMVRDMLEKKLLAHIMKERFPKSLFGNPDTDAGDYHVEVYVNNITPSDKKAEYVYKI
jgi:hypothetical protein